jgi:hypothetical protein
MKAKHLLIDDTRLSSRGGNPDLTVLPNPSPHDIETAITSFDTKYVQYIAIGEKAPIDGSELPFDGRGLVIGRSLDGLFYLVEHFDPVANLSAMPKAWEESENWIAVMYMQERLSNPVNLTDFSQTMQIVRHFCETLERLHSFEWEEYSIW